MLWLGFIIMSIFFSTCLYGEVFVFLSGFVVDSFGCGFGLCWGMGVWRVDFFVFFLAFLTLVPWPVGIVEFGSKKSCSAYCCPVR